jgi:hypothetical protein
MPTTRTQHSTLTNGSLTPRPRRLAGALGLAGNVDGVLAMYAADDAGSVEDRVSVEASALAGPAVVAAIEALNRAPPLVAEIGLVARLLRRALRDGEAAVREQASPAYGSVVPMRLQRLADDEIAAYLAERFRQTGRGIGEALNPLLGSAKRHPQRAMLLAHRLWEQLVTDENATLDDRQAAHAAALAELNPGFDAQWRGFDTSEQKTMWAVIADWIELVNRGHPEPGTDFGG